MFLFFIPTDHWNGKPCAALLETIRHRIEASDSSYKELFPPILKALRLKVPSRLTAMLAKVNRRVCQAKKTGNLMVLPEEVTGLAADDTDEIGPHCQKNGITPSLLLEGWFIFYCFLFIFS